MGKQQPGDPNRHRGAGTGLGYRCRCHLDPRMHVCTCALGRACPPAWDGWTHDTHTWRACRWMPRYSKTTSEQQWAANLAARRLPLCHQQQPPHAPPAGKTPSGAANTTRGPDRCPIISTHQHTGRVHIWYQELLQCGQQHGITHQATQVRKHRHSKRARGCQQRHANIPTRTRQASAMAEPRWRSPPASPPSNPAIGETSRRSQSQASRWVPVGAVHRARSYHLHLGHRSRASTSKTLDLGGSACMGAGNGQCCQDAGAMHTAAGSTHIHTHSITQCISFACPCAASAHLGTCILLAFITQQGLGLGSGWGLALLKSSPARWTEQTYLGGAGMEHGAGKAALQ